MARTVRDTNLENGEKRRALPVSRKPRWRVLEAGLHVGYRRVKEGGGSWIARRFIGEGRYLEKRLGTADDLQDADGKVVLTFSQAQEAARKWWRNERRREEGLPPEETGPYTVERAISDYFDDRERSGSKGVAKARSAASLRILPALGQIELAKLTSRQLREWHTGLAKAPKLARAGADPAKRRSAPVNMGDREAIRGRRSTANRTLTILKAALNHAFHENRIASDEAWRKVKPFREADAAIVRFLSEDECPRLANACDSAFRALVRAALLTGCRYGELIKMTAGDFNKESGTVTIRESKAGKPRHVALNSEGQTHFAEMTAGKSRRDLIFRRDDGKAWAASHQQRPLEAASRRAKIEPAATFHILRHTYASLLAMRGVPMGVIAAQLGHADTRMTEKHYAHLSPNFVAETIRAALPDLGGGSKSNVVALS